MGLRLLKFTLRFTGCIRLPGSMGRLIAVPVIVILFFLQSSLHNPPIHLVDDVWTQSLAKMVEQRVVKRRLLLIPFKTYEVLQVRVFRDVLN